MRMGPSWSRLGLAFALALGCALAPSASAAEPLFVTPSAPPRQAAPTWQGTFKSTYGTLVFEVSAPGAIGNYVYGDGKPVHGHIEGSVDGTRLAFAWSEIDGAGSGHGVFNLEADGRRFVGTWGYGDSDHDGGEWSGERE
jgi:hypothetical protein